MIQPPAPWMQEPPHPPDHHLDRKLIPASAAGFRKEEQGNRQSPGAGGSLRPGDVLACPETGDYRVSTCPRSSTSIGQCVIANEFSARRGRQIAATSG